MGRDERRAQLIAAAGDVLRQPGSTLSFESIAEAAGVSPTLPYKYFESVDEVALALYEQFVQDIDDATEALLEDAAVDFDDKLRGAMTLWLDAMETDGRLLGRLTAADAPSGLQRSVAERRERVAELWAGEITATFGWDRRDADLAAIALIAASSTVMQRIRLAKLDRVDAVDTFVAMARGLCTGGGVSRRPR